MIRVIVAADDQFDHFGIDANLQHLRGWLNQIDVLEDGQPTIRARQVVHEGQTLMVRRIAYSATPPARPSSPDVIAATTDAYRDAVRWAGRGILGIALDHGSPGVAQLAPIRLAHVDGSIAQTLWLAERGRHPRSFLDTCTPLREITEIIRRSRVRHVELMTCSIGVGAVGRRLLEWLHQLWGRQVRALRGDLAIRQDQFGGYAARVVRPGSPRSDVTPTSDGYNVRWSRSIPQAPSLWEISSGRRPAIDDALTAGSP